MPIGDWRAEARAYAPANGGQVLIANFGPVAYHDPEPRLLEEYLRFAKPLGAVAADRMAGGRTQ